MTRCKAVIQVSETVEPMSLIVLCRIGGCCAEWSLELIDEGILEPVDEDHPGARFDSSSKTIIRRAPRLQADLRINLAGIAVTLPLVDENARLKRRLHPLEDTLPVAGPAASACLQIDLRQAGGSLGVHDDRTFREASHGDETSDISPRHDCH